MKEFKLEESNFMGFWFKPITLEARTNSNYPKDVVTTSSTTVEYQTMATVNLYKTGGKDEFIWSVGYGDDSLKGILQNKLFRAKEYDKYKDFKGSE